MIQIHIYQSVITIGPMFVKLAFYISIVYVFVSVPSKTWRRGLQDMMSFLKCMPEQSSIVSTDTA